MKCIAYIIKVVHLFIIIAVIASIFVKSRILKQLSLTFLVFLLLQYILGFKKCGLTELEYYFLGKNYHQGFIYRLINPIINIPENYCSNGILIIHLLMICVLIYQLYFVSK